MKATNTQERNGEVTFTLIHDDGARESVRLPVPSGKTVEQAIAEFIARLEAIIAKESYFLNV